MRDLIRVRLAQGSPTIPVAGAAAFPERLRGRPIVECEGRAALDLGACLFSPEEEDDTAECRVSFGHDHRLSSRTREGLVTSTGALEPPAPLDEAMRRLL